RRLFIFLPGAYTCVSPPDFTIRFFFFKQKTAYEVLRCLVGSEMCIRDRAWFAVPLVFGAWNALLARYAYAAGDTRLPLRCELLGSALNAALLAVLPLIFGLPGIPLAALGGVLCTALLLMRRQALLGALPWARLWLLNALAMALAAGLLFRIDGIWLQLGLGTVAGCLALLGMALWLRPWRTD
ncbi:lipid II flippase MurJ, partial [Pseudomonas aeruginosa]|uniref:lipid II flippase MurJ n=1 Tax=Pseudomonas aeruginosa TaxID=287 RepID=UPI0035B5C7F0